MSKTYSNQPPPASISTRPALRCFECGEDAQHRHHVVPRSLGGTFRAIVAELARAGVVGRTGRALDVRQVHNTTAGVPS